MQGGEAGDVTTGMPATRLHSGSTIRATMAGLLVLVAITAGMRWVVDAVGIDRIRETVAEAGPWAPVLYIFLRVVTFVIAPLRIPGLDLGSGVVFGVWLGTAYSLLADLIGGSINFWIARRLGQPVVARLIGSRAMNRMEDFYRQVGGWRGLLFARLFLPGYDFLSYAAGLTPLKFPVYAVVTALGGIPRTYLSVALGAALLADTNLLLAYYAALAVLYGLAIFVQQWWYHRSRRRRREAAVEGPIPTG
jgi:uncharacterized membrane protein YdjX (TVP38/TMEM64 family)